MESHRHLLRRQEAVHVRLNQLVKLLALLDTALSPTAGHHHPGSHALDAYSMNYGLSRMVVGHVSIICLCSSAV